MTIEQMKERKRELGYTTEKLAELSGVPVSTVRKIFSGATRAPRQDTIEALTKVLRKKQGDYTVADFDQLPEGRYIELLDGYFYGREGRDPLPQSVVDALLIEEAVAPYHAEKADGTSALSDNKEWLSPSHKGNKTLADFDAMPEGWRGELIDGELYGLAAPTTNHQRIILKMAFQFEKYALDTGHPCEVFPAPVDVQLRADIEEVLAPDLIVLCDPKKDTGKRIVGAPDLVAEVLSPSTRSRDMVLKLNRFMIYGVREYWIVDGDKREVLIYDFERGRIAERHSFDEKIPVGISEGGLTIDLSRL